MAYAEAAVGVVSSTGHLIELADAGHHSAMRKHSEKTDEPFDRRSQGH